MLGLCDEVLVCTGECWQVRPVETQLQCMDSPMQHVVERAFRRVACLEGGRMRLPRETLELPAPGDREVDGMEGEESARKKNECPSRHLGLAPGHRHYWVNIEYQSVASR